MLYYRDYIQGVRPRPEHLVIPWTSGYQMETDYEFRPTYTGDKLTFLWAKRAWDFRGDGTRYWNWPTEEDFEREGNGRWGMLLRCTNPVDAETLEIFHREHCATAVTGWLDYQTGSWIECEPTSERLGTQSCERHGHLYWSRRSISLQVSHPRPSASIRG